MRFFVMSAAAAWLALSSAGVAQEAQPAEPTPEQKKAQQARIQAINTYVQIRFAQEIEGRCDHLDEKAQAEFSADVGTVDSYMKQILSEETVKAVHKKAETAGADEKQNPCGEDSEKFIEQSVRATAQLSDSIEKSRQ